jgi:hypothetical protein
MQRRILDLSPEERKFVIRWQLALLGIYATIGLLGFVVLDLTSDRGGGTLAAQMKLANPPVPAELK